MFASLLISVLFLTVKAALLTTLRYPLPTLINRITEISTSCDARSLNISVSMEKAFKGLLFAKDFAQECRSFGTLTNSAVIALPTSGCGISLGSDSDKMFYAVTVVVQQDRHLKQVTDQETTVKCALHANALALKSEAMLETLKREMLKSSDAESNRTGRMRKTSPSEKTNELLSTEMNEKLAATLSATRAWMEIVPETTTLQSLQVGEPALLSIKCTLPAGIDWKVVDCTAHDGLGDASQKLVDEDGCAVDELLMPGFQKGIPRSIAAMRHQEAVSRFPAFKFPDRDRLHLSCGLQLCRGFCQKVDCNETDGRSGRQLPEANEVIDRLEVFNSVEVSAPGIELDAMGEGNKIIDPSMPSFATVPGDRSLCVSPEKIALTFCILGVIFLIAVVVAACALMKARRTQGGIPYYSRSLFSTNSSGSGGSKLLLHERRCLGQRSVPYGRVF